MKKINFKHHILPHLIAVLVFLVVSILFFNPVFFDNKTLDQQDINQWKGGAHESMEYREKTGEELLWTNSMFSGMPTYLIDARWNDGIVTTLKIIMAVGLPHPVRNIFLAFLSFYILLLAFRVRPWLAIAGGLAFGLSSYVIIGFAAGHNARIGAVAFMPLVIAGIHTCLYRNRWIGFGLTALAVSLHLRENHLQITYYLLFIVGLYFLVYLLDAVRRDELVPFLKNSGLLLVAALLALGTFYGKFHVISEYSHYSMRGVSELKADQEAGENTSGLKKSYAFNQSYGVAEPLTLFIPNVYGGSSSHLLILDEDSETRAALQRQGDQQLANQLARYSIAYWGPMALPTAPYYVGAVVVMLFVIGLVMGDRKLIFWLVPLTVLGMLLAMGDSFKLFNYLMFDYFPGYNKFRSVPFAIIITMFSMVLLGFTGLERLLLQKVNASLKRKFFICVGITAGLALLFVLFAGMAGFMRTGEEQLPEFFKNAMAADRESLLRSDALRSFFFVILTAGAVYLTYLRKLTPMLLGGILVVLVLADEWSVDARFIGEDNYRRKSSNEFFAKTEADAFILKDKEPGYRVYNLQSPLTEARTSYFHYSLGGYHGAKLRRYQELFDYCIMPETQEMIKKFQQGDMSMNDYGVINMLNTRYLVYGPDKDNVIPNPDALGNAWFVQNIIPVVNPDDEISQTCKVDPRQSAIVDVDHFSLDKNKYTVGEIRVKDYQPDDITYETQNRGEGLAVFSEIYYPEGWKVTIDGDEVPMLRADFVLRAVKVPAGNHTIRFVFQPESYTWGNRIMLVSSVLLLVVLAGSLFLGLRTAPDAPVVSAGADVNN